MSCSQERCEAWRDLVILNDSCRRGHTGRSRTRTTPSKPQDRHPLLRLVVGGLEGVIVTHYELGVSRSLATPS